MLMPVGTRFTKREYAGGWGELRATSEGVDFMGVARLGEMASAADIERVGVKLTGVDDRHWKVINEGRNENGWNWFVTVEASVNGQLYFGDYGTGPKGSYLLMLRTTERDNRQHESDYKAWYESIPALMR